MMSRHSNRQASDKRGRRPGRPTVMESRGDPKLPARAAEMRSLGLSWSQIASRLGVGRTTARRLALMCQKDSGCQTGHLVSPIFPKPAKIGGETSSSQNASSALDSGVLEKLPKTFRIFSELLEKARELQD